MRTAPRAGVTALLLLAVSLCLSQKTLISQEEPSAQDELVERLFGDAGRELSSRERRKALGYLNGRYVVVREKALGVLKRQRPSAEVGIRYGSQFHCALKTIRFWRMAEARAVLLDLLGLRLDPSSIPPGEEHPGSVYYPVAEALAALPIQPDRLLSRLSSENAPVLTWVLAEGLGRSATKVLLAHHVKGDQFDTPALKQALRLLEDTEHVSDLLPPVRR